MYTSPSEKGIPIKTESPSVPVKDILTYVTEDYFLKWELFT